MIYDPEFIGQFYIFSSFRQTEEKLDEELDKLGFIWYSKPDEVIPTIIRDLSIADMREDQKYTSNLDIPLLVSFKVLKRYIEEDEKLYQIYYSLCYSAYLRGRFTWLRSYCAKELDSIGFFERKTNG